MKRGGRYNVSGQFVSAGELGQQERPVRATAAQSFSSSYAPTSQVQQQQAQLPPKVEFQDEDEIMQETNTSAENNGNEPSKPSWMKPARKISKKERRRRQNEQIRRLISPKNALMVLNELLPGEVTSNSFTVEPTAQDLQYFNHEPSQKFCAAYTVDGVVYKAYGDNKVSARNAVAEKAIRDLVIKRMSKTLLGSKETIDLAANMDDEGGEEDQDSLPMIQVASFALHKLFTEWQCDGFQVPSLRPQPPPAAATPSVQSDNESVASKKSKKPKVKELPAGAENMHPCMLLTHMRAGPTAPVYHELGAEGGTPQTMMFTMGVTVDGTTYIGKASNKKEARKQAARSACEDIFKIKYPL